jgi:hypothetical protein
MAAYEKQASNSLMIRDEYEGENHGENLGRKTVDRSVPIG